MFKYYLLLLGLLIFTACGAENAPMETFDYATVVEVKDARTHEGNDGNNLWYAEIDIVFSQTPIDLETLHVSATHFIDHDENHLADFYWEQTGNIVTLYLTFIGVALFQDWSDIPLTYKQAKEMYSDIDWDNFTTYTIDFTLDWDIGRKQFEGVPIRPSQQILERFSASDE